MDKYHLNLFLPANTMEEAAKNCTVLQNISLYPLESWKAYTCEIRKGGSSVNLVGLPTNGKVILVSKKILSIFLKLQEKADAETVYLALWPNHPEYDVSIHAQPFLRQTFLPGLTTYNCVASGSGFLLEASMAPDIAEADVLNDIRCKLTAAGLTPAELCLQSVIQDSYRTKLDSSVLDALVRSFRELTDRGPEFEWYPIANPLYKIGQVLPNTFAIGSGPFPDAMCVSWKENQAKKAELYLDCRFWLFVQKFSEMLE